MALRQHGVFSLAQLKAIGITARAAQMQASRGRLYRIHRSVYSLVPRALLSGRGRLMAAVLACGPGAALSHRSAAMLHDIRRTDRARIDVTVPGRRRVTIDGVDVHSSRTLTEADITEVDGIPCTSIARTLFDLVSVVPRRAVERALDEAEIRELLDLRKLANVLERNRHTGTARSLRRILAEYTADAPNEEGVEEDLFALCRAAKIPLPERQVWINPDDGEPAIRADFVWREQRLVVETDGGRFHRTRRAFESDRRRDQRLLLAGWRVIRITWRQIHEEPLRIQRLIAAALRQV